MKLENPTQQEVKEDIAEICNLQDSNQNVEQKKNMTKQSEADEN